MAPVNRPDNAPSRRVPPPHARASVERAFTTILTYDAPSSTFPLVEHLTMPRTFGETPFAYVVLDQDEAVSGEDVQRVLREGDGSASLCLRLASGPPQRGGYFFHFERFEDGFRLTDFGGDEIAVVSRDEIVRLINHAAGRVFDPEILRRCQVELNFRLDP